MADIKNIRKASLLNRVKHTILRLAYSCSLFIFLPILLVFYRKKLYQTKHGLHGHRFTERLGFLSDDLQAGGVHVHCVSVGEINTARPLIELILELYPHLPLTLSTSSVSGALHAQNTFADRVQHCYLPIDIPFCMRLFCNKIKPILSLVTEIEIWPNLVYQLHKQETPIVLINARMTQQVLKRYKRFSSLFRPTLRQIDYVCAQDLQSFQNFIKFGLYKQQLRLSRNMKFDMAPRLDDHQLGRHIVEHFDLHKRKIIVAAYTHYPEESILLNEFIRLQSEISNLTLVMIPHHPNRFDSVKQTISACGLTFVSASDIENNDWVCNHSPECVLIDKVGWTKACYSIAHVAFIGGTLVDQGGYNPLECAQFSKPIVMGPNISNNPSICEKLKAQSALQLVENESALYEALKHWLLHEEHAQMDGERGSKVIVQNVGAVEYTFSIIRPLLDAQLEKV